MLFCKLCKKEHKDDDSGAWSLTYTNKKQNS